MSEKSNGGPAFPQPCAENGWASNNEYGQAGGGLSLRDYFAAKAMQSFLLWPDAPETPGGEIAKSAYLMADKMLEERAK